MNLLAVLAGLACLLAIHSTPVYSVDYLSYLKKYGYLETGMSDLTDDDYDSVRKAIFNFQANAGIKETGLMNEETENMMKLPRCGVSDDIMHIDVNQRVKRYVVSRRKWGHLNITYKITKYSVQISKEDVDTALIESFKFWGDASKLTFKRVSENENSDLDIRFATGLHKGDNTPFDGPSHVLAHAFLPRVGMVHFDDAESWTLTKPGINLLQVMTHELGHALGLRHSHKYKAVMYPFYKGYQKNFHLDADDIEGITSLYGVNTVTTTTTTTTIAPVTDVAGVDVCKDGVFDATIMDENNKLKAFRGKYFYNIFTGKRETFSNVINYTFPGAPSHIDAALYLNYRALLFKDGNLYSYLNTKAGYSLELGYPRAAGHMFPGIPERISAAFKRNGNIYFVGQGGDYVTAKVNNRYTVGVQACQPPVTNLPKYIDAVFSWGKHFTYFLSGNRFYKAYGRHDKIKNVGISSKFFLKCK